MEGPALFACCFWGKGRACVALLLPADVGVARRGLLSVELKLRRRNLLGKRLILEYAWLRYWAPLRFRSMLEDFMGARLPSP
jgi:hypothetical protein